MKFPKMHVSPEREFKEMRNVQRIAHRNGTAIKNHQITCHNGYFNINCSACKELKRKFDRLSGYDV